MKPCIRLISNLLENIAFFFSQGVKQLQSFLLNVLFTLGAGVRVSLEDSLAGFFIEFTYRNYPHSLIDNSTFSWGFSMS